MATGIPYADEVCNAVVGCTHSGMLGCDNCWSRELHMKRYFASLDGKKVAPQYRKPFGFIQLLPERIEQVLHWRKSRTIFWCSTSDMFHPDVPFELIDQVMAVIYQTSSLGHTHLILTKRVERMADYFASGVDGRVLGRLRRSGWAEPSALLTCSVACTPNLLTGISCSTQADLDKMAPIHLQIPGRHWLSLEPLLGHMDLTRYIGGWDEDGHCKRCGLAKEEGIEVCDCPPGFGPKYDGLWVVIGCESGSKRRLCKLEWVRSVVRQSKDATVPVYVKQLNIGGRVVTDIKDFPADLRIQEKPK